MDKVEGGIQSVATAMALLDAFAQDEQLGVSDVARRLEVSPSTAHRLLTTLVAGGLVEQVHEYGNYRLGTRLIELGQLATERLELRRISMGVLEELREASGWTVHLTITQGADSLSIERLTTRRASIVSGDLRHRWPLHVTSSGKVLCAFDANARAARLAAGLDPKTRQTITSPEQFEGELATIRRQGFARARDELMLNVSSIAAPILDVYGTARAAVSVLGSTAQFDQEEPRLTNLVVAAARRLSHRYQRGGSTR